MIIKHVCSITLLFTNLIFLNSFGMKQSDNLKITLVTGQARTDKTYLISKFLKTQNIDPESCTTTLDILEYGYVKGAYTLNNIEKKFHSTKNNNPAYLIIKNFNPLFSQPTLSILIKKLKSLTSSINKKINLILISGSDHEEEKNEEEIKKFFEILSPIAVTDRLDQAVPINHYIHVDSTNKTKLDKLGLEASSVEKISSFNFNIKLYKENISKIIINNKTKISPIDFLCKYVKKSKPKKINNETNAKKYLTNLLTSSKTFNIKKDFIKLYNYIIIVDDLKKIEKLPPEIALSIVQFINIKSCYDKKNYYKKRKYACNIL